MRKQVSALSWVYIAGVGFAITLVAAIVLMAVAGRVMLSDDLYFLILVPLGLSASGFLFGALRSFARYKGNAPSGTLELGGPAVLFLIVILLGLYANRAKDFSLTVRVHGPGGPSDVIREGSLTAYLGNVQRTSQIGDDGEVILNGVPSALIGEKIRLLPSVPGYESTSSDSVIVPESHVIDLALSRRNFSTTVRGTVVDDLGNPIGEAALDFNSGMVTVVTDPLGNFSAALPLAPGTVIPLIVRRSGFMSYDYPVTVTETPPLRITLRKSQP